MVNVFHDDGSVFLKLEADTGISYIAVELDEITKETDNRSLLVRHGNPEKGACGYYPLMLLFATPERRFKAARKANKRPPSEYWVNRMKEDLNYKGLPTLH